MEGFCRGCLIKYDDPEELLEYTEKNRRLFIYSTGIQVKRNDTFMFQLCKDCYLNMKQSCKFKKLCRTSDKKFKTYLSVKESGDTVDLCTYLKNNDDNFTLRFPNWGGNSTPAYQKKDDDNESTCTSIGNFMRDILPTEMPDSEARIIRQVIEEEADVLDESLDSHWLQDDVSIDTNFQLDFSFSPFSTPRSVNNDHCYTPKRLTDQENHYGLPKVMPEKPSAQKKVDDNEVDDKPIEIKDYDIFSDSLLDKIEDKKYETSVKIENLYDHEIEKIENDLIVEEVDALSENQVTQVNSKNYYVDNTLIEQTVNDVVRILEGKHVEENPSDINSIFNDRSAKETQRAVASLFDGKGTKSQSDNVDVFDGKSGKFQMDFDIGLDGKGVSETQRAVASIFDGKRSKNETESVSIFYSKNVNVCQSGSSGISDGKRSKNQNVLTNILDGKSGKNQDNISSSLGKSNQGKKSNDSLDGKIGKIFDGGKNQSLRSVLEGKSIESQNDDSIERRLDEALKEENQEITLEDLLGSPAVNPNTAASTPTIHNIIFGENLDLDDQLKVGRTIEKLDNVEGDINMYDELFDTDIKEEIKTPPPSPQPEAIDIEVPKTLTINVSENLSVNVSYSLPEKVKLQKKKQKRTKKKIPPKPDYEDVVLVDCVCKICDKKFKDMRILKLHTYKKHNIRLPRATKRPEAPKLRICDHCGKQDMDKRNFVRHVKTHVEKKIKCEICEVIFFSKAKFNMHYKTHLGNNHKQQPGEKACCDICGREVLKKSLYKHRRIHNKQYRGHCEDCGKGYYTPADLRAHKLINQAMAVENTSDGTLNVDPTGIPIFQSPRGQLPLKETSEQNIHTSVLERAVKMEVDEEKGKEDSKTTHIKKWLQDTPESNQKGSSGIQHPVPSTSGMTREINVEDVGSEFDSEFDDEFDLEEYTGKFYRMSETEPQVAEAMCRAMDNAVESLVDVSTDFSWHADYDSFKSRPEVFTGPTPGPIHNYDDPYEAFTSIFNNELMEIIVRETNRYARQTIDASKSADQMKPTSRVCRWTDTNVGEMYVFIAIFILMGIDVRSSVHEYWLTTGILQMPMFRQLMSYNRYILLSKFLRFTDNSAPQNLPQGEGFTLSAKVAKLKPVILHLNRQFTTLYNLHKDIAIDESLTLFKGRLSWVEPIRSEAARFGIKSFELCESRTGYLYKFSIYTGKNPIDNDFIAPSEALARKTTQVVLDLLRGLDHRGHLVTMDSFYNCPALTRYLKSLGFDNLGTLRPNRKHVPVDIAEAPSNVTKGTIIARHSGDVSCIAWKDSKMVNMISSYHTDETCDGGKAGRDLVKPIAVRDYNNTMGRVDLKDQKLSMYLLERKRCVKWYVKMFKRILNASVHNAFIMLSESLRRRGLPSMTHQRFRYQLAESLAQKHCHSFPQEIRLETGQLRLRRDIIHVPLAIRGNDNRSLCHICLRNDIKKKVNFRCDTCDEFMCLGDCWVTWHSAENLPGREVFSRKSRRRKEHTGERPHACTVCGDKFIRRNALIRHMRAHTGEKRFACDNCHKRYANKPSLVQHIASGRCRDFKTTGKMNKIRQKPIRPQKTIKVFKLLTEEELARKPFECAYCHTRHRSENVLIRHQQISKTCKEIQFKEIAPTIIEILYEKAEPIKEDQPEDLSAKA